jgi:hypothetical protein
MSAKFPTPDGRVVLTCAMQDDTAKAKSAYGYALSNGDFMKHFIGVGALVALALIVRLGAFERFGLDIYVHDTYRAVPLRVVGFWVLIGIAAAWFLVAAYKFGRHSS